MIMIWKSRLIFLIRKDKKAKAEYHNRGKAGDIGNICRTYEGGSIVVEAALILPLFLCFVLTLITFIQISLIDSALQVAVSETSKQVAAHMYAADLIAAEYNNSQVGQTLNQYIDNIIAGKKKITDTKRNIARLGDLVPDVILNMLQWEQELREKAEQEIDEQGNRLLNYGFYPIVSHYANPRILLNPPNHLRVVRVHLPNLRNKEEAIFGIEAEYEYTLPIPFIHQVIRIRKAAYERAWVGE